LFHKNEFVLLELGGIQVGLKESAYRSEPVFMRLFADMEK